MRLLTSLKLLLPLLLLITLVSSCKEEELTTSGALEVTFTNHPSDLEVYISPAENSQIQISGPLKPRSDGKLTYNLNYGNYILKTYSSTTFTDVGFQIRAGKTTAIYFHSNNMGHVQ